MEPQIVFAFIVNGFVFIRIPIISFLCFAAGGCIGAANDFGVFTGFCFFLAVTTLLMRSVENVPFKDSPKKVKQSETADRVDWWK